ncbi:lipoate--protein ligase [Sinanaerobacter chloroacetimidivorans]|uniref:lipoate--protein ligase n=1 Tax=Sinanaerobacter chloroacetimidivorans TaxID=2818044 RepID=A0A8J8B1B3_9FIRM|nr:lipoate--protein ligase [Sinanaerobacter chloroacetimidivorans]MBR0598553.1 lipoate--protein ligase [Sinanaerobacter chloroacetimidivorans]
MINIINDSTDPYFNLALEEYFVKYRDLNEDILILWQNEPTIVVGKNQNTYEEIDLDYVKKNNINIVRRMSGGGAVYHDLGNLNYTIIKNDGQHKNDFSFFALPVISCLEKFGIEATFNGRNDILIDGKKISGNAQYFYKEKVLHHGTLLFSSDLNILSLALNVKKEKIESKGIQSVKSRVTNISEYVEETVSLPDFREALIISMFGENEKNIQNYKLSDEDISAITLLKNKKYSTWEWNFGQSPSMNYEKEIWFNAGNVTLALNIKGGKIEHCKLYGDFFEVKPIEELEQQFINKRYDKSELEAILCNISISDYILSLDNNEFVKLLF